MQHSFSFLKGLRFLTDGLINITVLPIKPKQTILEAGIFLNPSTKVKTFRHPFGFAQLLGPLGEPKSTAPGPGQPSQPSKFPLGPLPQRLKEATYPNPPSPAPYPQVSPEAQTLGQVLQVTVLEGVQLLQGGNDHGELQSRQPRRGPVLNSLKRRSKLWRHSKR